MLMSRHAEFRIFPTQFWSFLARTTLFLLIATRTYRASCRTCRVWKTCSASAVARRDAVSLQRLTGGKPPAALPSSGTGRAAATQRLRTLAGGRRTHVDRRQAVIEAGDLRAARTSTTCSKADPRKRLQGPRAWRLLHFSSNAQYRPSADIRTREFTRLRCALL